MRYNIYKMQKLLTVYKYFILLFPLAMFFSFRPWISLGTNETMNFEISLTMIWLVLFDVLSFFVLVFTSGSKRGNIQYMLRITGLLKSRFFSFNFFFA